MHTRVSHRSPPSCRLPSRGDAWVPPVNFTAFICPDEWRAALSAPLPAISSGSPEPHRFARPLSLPTLLPGPHTNTAEVQNHADDTARALCQTTGGLAYISWKHTLKADEHKQPANPASLFLRFFLVASSKKCFFLLPLSFSLSLHPPQFLGGKTKEITPLFLPGSCQNNQCFPGRDWWCDTRGEAAGGRRRSSGAPVGDNK